MESFFHAQTLFATRLRAKEFALHYIVYLTRLMLQCATEGWGCSASVKALICKRTDTHTHTHTRTHIHTHAHTGTYIPYIVYRIPLVLQWAKEG